jgi:hypothetical protein
MQINLIGKTPPEQEYGKLTSLTFERKPISAIERSRKIKQGFTYLGVSLLCAAVLAVCYFVFDVVLIAFVLALAVPVCLVISAMCFLGIFKNPQSKTSQKALDVFIKYTLLGEDSALSNDLKCERLEYTYEHLNRTLPSAIMPGRDFMTYVQGFRTLCQNQVDADFAAKFGRPAEKDEPISQSVNTGAVTVDAVSAGIERHSLHFDIIHQRGNALSDSDCVVYSQIGVNISMTVIQSGQYWYVYDPMPQYSVDGSNHES